MAEDDFLAIGGEGGGSLEGEADSTDGLLPEISERPPIPPVPTSSAVALCPRVECCPLNPFEYRVSSEPEDGPTISIGNDVLCSVCYNEAYTNYITADGLGAALTWTIEEGSLPTGLTFHGGYNEDGRVLIDGTPSVAGSYTFTVKATAPNGESATQTFTLGVMQITTTELPDFVVGENYYLQLEAIGGSGNYGWNIESGALPDGVILTPAGVITGVPTGIDSGDLPIIFKVSDITCEEFNPVFTPVASITAVSSNTTVATVLGFIEWPGLESTPPKKYKKATWEGFSEQQLWVGGDGNPYTPTDPVQIGGARYEYSGFDAIDTHGTLISQHVKNYFAMCNGDPSHVYSEIQSASVDPAFPWWPRSISFQGYYGIAGGESPDFLGYPTVLCPSASIPYAFIGDKATPTTSNVWLDSSGLWGTARILSTTDLGVTNFVGVNPTLANAIESGTELLSRIARYLPITYYTYIPPYARPADYWITGKVIYDSNYSVQLSDEYTDEEALSNATTTIGHSMTAENLPRTTGFISRWTSVNYDITCTNLVVGAHYLVTVRYIDFTSSIVTQFSEGFVATASTHVLNRNIPNPDPGHTLTVSNPTIEIVP